MSSQTHNVTPIHSTDNEVAITEIETMVRCVSRLLVDSPDDVVVHRAQGDGFYHLEVICDESDAGALIGQRGRHAKAIRLLAMRAATARDIRVTINILSRDQYALAPK